MKRIPFLFLAASLLCSVLSGCSLLSPAPTPVPTAEVTETPVPTETPAPTPISVPVTSYGSYEALLAAVPGITMNDAPTGADGIFYGVIQTVPQIAQITFFYDGADYDYRAALCASEGAQRDIAACSQPFPGTEPRTVATGEAYLLGIDPAGTAALASWYSVHAACQYTIFTQAGGAAALATMTGCLLPEELTLSGTIASISGASLRLATATGETFAFTMSDVALVSGAATSVADLVAGATVTVSYVGDLVKNPSAVGIRVLSIPTPSPAPTVTPVATDDPLVNKSLTGEAVNRTQNKLTVLLKNGKKYSFVLNGQTTVLGDYALEAGCRVTVTYDGYASTTPPAKVVQVLSAPVEPTDVPVIIYTVSGNILMHAGNALTITDANGATYSFLLAAPTITGDPESANYATVSYYIEDGGAYHATQVDFSIVLIGEN